MTVHGRTTRKRAFGPTCWIALGTAFIAATACSDTPTEAAPTLEGDYYAVMSALGPLPVRIDPYLDDTSGFEWVDSVDLHFDRDGSYEMRIAIRDSFPVSQLVHEKEWVVAGQYRIEADTLIYFEIDSELTHSRIGARDGRVRPKRTLWISMLGLLFCNEVNQGA